MVNKLISIAADEVGYIEKRSCEGLDSKMGNAGSSNYTKYWRDVAPSFQGQPWCACFVTWVMDRAFGKSAAKALLGHYPFVYCPTLATIGKGRLHTYTDAAPGDVALFYSSGTFCHTGIVVSNTNGVITTIEGNTTSGSSLVANGGGVARKTYSHSYFKTNKSGTRFYRPDYSILQEDTMTNEQVKAIAREATADIINAIGKDISTLTERLTKLEALVDKRNEQIWETNCRIDDIIRDKGER